MPASVAKPITSQKTIDALSAELRRMKESYYLIFNIMLETGMPLSHVLKSKVSDLYRHPKLTYASRHRTTTYKVPISLRLQRDIAAHLKGHKPDEFAFTAEKNSSKEMYPVTFQDALARACARLGISPAVNASSLRKTFIYNTVVNDGNYIRAAHFTDSSGPKEVRQYLGIDLPGDIDFAQVSKELTKATSRKAIPKLRDKLNAALDEVERLSANEDARDMDNTIAALSLLKALNDILDQR